MPLIAFVMWLSPLGRAQPPRDCAPLFAPVARRADADARVRLARWRKRSPSLDRLDNFTAPALLTTEILDPKISAVALLYLNFLGRLPTVLGATAPETRDLLALIESRYRIAVEILGAAYRVKYGRRLELTDAGYARGLLERTGEILGELGIGGIDGDAAAIERGLAAGPLFQYPIGGDDRAFRQSFLDALDDAAPFATLLPATEAYLERRLSEVPVGISYRIAELTSTIRFGDRHFYGSWFMYTSTDRAAFLRGARAYGGLVEAELNVSNRRKKRLALLLDLNFGRLDPIFRAPRPRGRWLHTCGTFPPVTLARAGIPVVTPLILAPGATVLSLAVQRGLRCPNVKSVSATRFSPLGTAKDALALLHELGIPFIVELPLYARAAAWLGLF